MPTFQAPITLGMVSYSLDILNSQLLTYCWTGGVPIKDVRAETVAEAMVDIFVEVVYSNRSLRIKALLWKPTVDHMPTNT